MLEKIKCPERDSNPRHPDLMKGALTTELPRQPQRSESNISYKGTLITRHLLPGLSDWELLLLIVETKAHRTRCISRPIHVNEISFSYEKMGTKTRFEEEAEGNSEMVYCVLLGPRVRKGLKTFFDRVRPPDYC